MSPLFSKGIIKSIILAFFDNIHFKLLVYRNGIIVNHVIILPSQAWLGLEITIILPQPLEY